MCVGLVISFSLSVTYDGLLPAKNNITTFDWLKFIAAEISLITHILVFLLIIYTMIFRLVDLLQDHRLYTQILSEKLGVRLDLQHPSNYSSWIAMKNYIEQKSMYWYHWLMDQNTHLFYYICFYVSGFVLVSKGFVYVCFKNIK